MCPRWKLAKPSRATKYRRAGYKDHNCFLMTKWLKRDIK
jgi:hypothetical protein